LGFLYNDLAGQVASWIRADLKGLLRPVILYVLDFDLLAPPYDQVNQVTVSEMNELNASPAQHRQATGFPFSGRRGPTRPLSSKDGDLPKPPDLQISGAGHYICRPLT
jgi:hypothetical protein